jgi:hypothetical protein
MPTRVGGRVTVSVTCRVAACLARCMPERKAQGADAGHPGPHGPVPHPAAAAPPTAQVGGTCARAVGARPHPAHAGARQRTATHGTTHAVARCVCTCRRAARHTLLRVLWEHTGTPHTLSPLPWARYPTIAVAGTLFSGMPRAARHRATQLTARRALHLRSLLLSPVLPTRSSRPCAVKVRKHVPAPPSARLAVGQRTLAPQHLPLRHLAGGQHQRHTGGQRRAAGPAHGPATQHLVGHHDAHHGQSGVPAGAWASEPVLAPRACCMSTPSMRSVSHFKWLPPCA